MEFEVPDQFLEYKDLAVTRLQYLYPDLSIKASKKIIIVDLPHENTSIDLEKNLKKEIYFQLYRAKIYQDTLPMKKWLFSDTKKDHDET